MLFVKFAVGRNQSDQIGRIFATLAKFQKSSAITWGFIFCRDVQPTLAIFYNALEQIFVGQFAKCWNHYLAIWSHWPECNFGCLVSDATALPTVQQPLPNKTTTLLEWHGWNSRVVSVPSLKPLIIWATPVVHVIKLFWKKSRKIRFSP